MIVRNYFENKYITVDNYHINLKDFEPKTNHMYEDVPWLGLEHFNEAPERRS